MLHLTNGDSAADLIREAGIGGKVLPWRDVLHMGPVPDKLSSVCQKNTYFGRVRGVMAMVCVRQKHQFEGVVA